MSSPIGRDIPDALVLNSPDSDKKMWGEDDAVSQATGEPSATLNEDLPCAPDVRGTLLKSDAPIRDETASRAQNIPPRERCKQLLPIPCQLLLTIS